MRVNTRKKARRAVVKGAGNLCDLGKHLPVWRGVDNHRGGEHGFHFRRLPGVSCLSRWWHKWAKGTRQNAFNIKHHKAWKEFFFFSMSSEACLDERAHRRHVTLFCRTRYKADVTPIGRAHLPFPHSVYGAPCAIFASSFHSFIYWDRDNRISAPSAQESAEKAEEGGPFHPLHFLKTIAVCVSVYDFAPVSFAKWDRCFLQLGKAAQTLKTSQCIRPTAHIHHILLLSFWVLSELRNHTHRNTQT